MATEINYTVLATRLPREVCRALKLHCVKVDVTQMSFIKDAIVEKLKKASK